MKEIENKNFVPLVISMYIGSLSNVTPYIYLVCSDTDNYLKSAEIAMGKDIKISVQQTISGIEPPPMPKPQPVTPPPPAPKPKTNFKPETILPAQKKTFNKINEIISGFHLSFKCEKELKKVTILAL